MPELLSMRTADPDDKPVRRIPARAREARGIEDTIIQGLMTAYPLADVVSEVDDRFDRLLEAMAALDLGHAPKA